MIRAAVLLALLPLPGLAQDFPALYDVTGVAADDVLNVRARPSARAPIIGSFAPDATGIEVVAGGSGGAWGLVNAGGQSGWTSLAYLSRRDGHPPGEPIAELHCAGTEPFWSLDLDGDAARFATPDGPGETVALGDPVPAAGRSDRWALRGLGGDLTAVLSRSLCSDGMSDRSYGLSVDLVLSGAGGPGYYSGCCELVP